MKKVFLILVLLYFFINCCYSQSNIFELTEVSDGQISQPVENTSPIDFKWNENGVIKSFKEEIKGKVTFLNFFGSWCGPCNSEAPALQRIYSNFKDKNFFMLAYAFEKSSDPFQTLKNFVEHYGIEFPNLTTNDKGLNSKMGNAYLVAFVPATYILNHNGIIVYSTVGSIEETEVEELIINLLKASPVNETNFENALKIFPNPVIGDGFGNVQLQLSENSNINIELFDMFGNKVKDIYSSQNCFGNLTVPFSLSGLSSGVYFLKIDVNGKHQTKILHKE